jgi:L-iditol 2-dehydrogenase
MKIARLYSFEDIRVEEMPAPVPGPREALIRTRASGICSGDIMPWYIEKKAPLVLGHEPAGEVVVLGESASEVTDLKVGDRVFVHHHAPCLNCPLCEKGEHVHCHTWKTSAIVPGGISEYILVPEVNLRNDTLRLPDNVSFEEAVFIEPLACVLKGLNRAMPVKGATAFVIGLGVMGMLNVLALKALGAAHVIGSDFSQKRLHKAVEIGADAVIDVSREDPIESLRSLTHGRMADIVISGPNSADAMELAIKTAAPGGRVVLFTPAKPGETLTVDPNYLYFHEISLIPSYSTGPRETRQALKMIEEGAISVGSLITHRFPIEETPKAYRLAAEAGDSLKVMIVF